MSHESEQEEVNRLAQSYADSVDRAVRLMKEEGDADDARTYLSAEGIDIGDFFTNEDDEEEYDETSLAETVLEGESDSLLEFYSKGKRYNDEWNVTEHIAVFGTGGPHAEMSSNGYVTVYWARNRAERGVDDADYYFSAVCGVED